MIEEDAMARNSHESNAHANVALISADSTSGKRTDTVASACDQMLCCEARNSLQVVLSGAEILLEDHFGNLQPAQKLLLTKVMDNAYHLCNLIATLAGPSDFKIARTTGNEVATIAGMVGT